MNKVFLISLFMFLEIESAFPQGIVYSIPESILDSIEIQESKSLSSKKSKLFQIKKREAHRVLSEFYIHKNEFGLSIAPMYNYVSDTSTNYYSFNSNRFFIINNRPVPIYFDYDNILGTTATLSELSTNPNDRIYKHLFVLSHPSVEYIVPSDYKYPYQKSVLHETNSFYRSDIVYILPIQLEQVLDLIIKQTDGVSKAIYLSISFDQIGTLLLLDNSISFDSYILTGRKALVGKQLLPVVFDYDCIFGGFSFPLNQQGVLARLKFQLYPFQIQEFSLP